MCTASVKIELNKLKIVHHFIGYTSTNLYLNPRLQSDLAIPKSENSDSEYCDPDIIKLRMDGDDNVSHGSDKFDMEAPTFIATNHQITSKFATDDSIEHSSNIKERIRVENPTSQQPWKRPGNPET